MGITVSSENDQLLTGSGTAASPWVIAVEQAGIAGLPSVINVVVLISAFVSFFLLATKCNAHSYVLITSLPETLISTLLPVLSTVSLATTRLLLFSVDAPRTDFLSGVSS